MKKLLWMLPLLIIVMTNAVSSMAQDYIVVDYPDRSQKDIHSDIKSWIAKSFVSANNVIQHESETKIIIKAEDRLQTRYQYSVHEEAFNYVVSYIIDIEIKDNRYRYKFDNVNIRIDKNTIPYNRYPEYVRQENERTLKNWQILKKARQQPADARTSTIDKINHHLQDLEIEIKQIPKQRTSTEW